MLVTPTPLGTDFIEKHLPLTQFSYEAQFVSGAIATPRRIQPGNVFTGAVYRSDGTLIPAATVGYLRKDIQSNDPATLDFSTPDAIQENKDCLHLYCGNLIDHFGHFLVETMARLWFLGSWKSDKPVICHYHHWFNTADLDVFRRRSAFAEQLFSTAGLEWPDIRLIQQPIQFEELIVPDPLSILDKRMHPEYGQMFERIAERLCANAEAAPYPTKIFLSKSRWIESGGRNLTGRFTNNEAIEAAFARHGYAVIYPEAHSLEEQIAFVRHAGDIAFFDGTVGHLLLFARPGTRSLSLDTRNVPMQYAIERVKQIQARHYACWFPPPVQDESRTLCVESLSGILGE